MNTIKNGVYPTMITPFGKTGAVDYAGVQRLTEWYAGKGAEGIFAVCQSSEMFFLSLDERVGIAKTVVRAAAAQRARPSVVVSGHIADSVQEQAEELCAMAETGADAVVWVSNRLDVKGEGDRVWLKNAEALLSLLPGHIPLGIYECPYPYKKELSREILDWCRKSGRFSFIKDTCCDPDTLTSRLRLLEGSGVKLFNANSQTLLHSLIHGASGFSGVMGNFHPELYVWLCKNYARYPKKAQRLQNDLALYAFTESLAYPITAKYHMRLEGIGISLYARAKKTEEFTPYQKHILDNAYLMERQWIGEYL